MSFLWEVPSPASVREVLEGLDVERDLAYTTVMTVLDNLHRKDFVRRHKDGRAYRYEPVQSREQYSAMLMEEVLSTSVDRSAVLLHFVQAMDTEEVAGLRKALERRRGSGNGS